MGGGKRGWMQIKVEAKKERGMKGKSGRTGREGKSKEPMSE